MVCLQGQLKELHRELEEGRAAHKEILASTREAERRCKNLEAEILQMQEVSSVTSGFSSSGLH